MSRLERRAARPMSARNAAKTAPAKEPVPEEALPIEGPPGPCGEGGGEGSGAGPPPPCGEPSEPPSELGAPLTPSAGASGCTGSRRAVDPEIAQVGPGERPRLRELRDLERRRRRRRDRRLRTDRRGRDRVDVGGSGRGHGRIQRRGRKRAVHHGRRDVGQRRFDCRVDGRVDGVARWPRYRARPDPRPDRRPRRPGPRRGRPPDRPDRPPGPRPDPPGPRRDRPRR